ncbi:Ig-like domain-containing protein [bacterium]|nr:Ig-like domain-containing protein [bacterium]
MRRLLTILFLLTLVVSASLADDWTQNYWDSDHEGDMGYHDGSYFAQSGVATRRLWGDSTDSSILLDGPDWSRSLHSITNLPGTIAEITCGTVLTTTDGSAVILGGRTDSDHPAFWYTTDGGASWTENSNDSIDSASVWALSPDSTGTGLLVLSFKETVPKRITVHRLSSLPGTWGTAEYSDLAVGDIVNAATFFVTSNGSELFSYSDQGTTGGALYRYNGSDWTRVTNALPTVTDYFELWETGVSSSVLFLGLDNGAGNDRPYYTADASGSGGWNQWHTDYVDPGNYVRFADYQSPSNYIFLGANSTNLCRVNYNSPSTSQRISDANMTTIYDLNVSDYGRPWVSYSDGTDRWLKPCLDAEGTTWANPIRLANFDTAPAVLQDAFGLGYFAGTRGNDGILSMSYPIETGWLESSVYDCGGPTTFDSLLLDYDYEEGSSSIKLRSADSADMSDADAWEDCDFVTNYNDLSDLAGLYDGRQYVQYLIVFNLPDSFNPWQQNILNRFTLTYHEFEEDPRVIGTIPERNDTDVPTNVNIVIFFNKEMDPSTLNPQTIVVRDGGDPVDWQGTYNHGDNAFRIDPNNDFYSYSTVTVLLQGDIRDAGGTLLGDQNGESPGLYSFQFETSGSADDSAPVITEAEVTPNPTFGQAQLTLTGQVSDVDYGDSDITYAEYFIDNIGDDWEGTAVSATDGSFDSPTEDLLALIDASGWSLGSTHQIYLHAADSADNFSQYKVINVETEGGFLEEDSVYAWPNPATTDTAHFKCTLGGDGKVELFVYDLAGRQVHHDSTTAISGEAVEFEWNLSGVGSDVYLFRIYATETNGSNRTGVVVKKLAIVR